MVYEFSQNQYNFTKIKGSLSILCVDRHTRANDRTYGTIADINGSKYLKSCTLEMMDCFRH